MSGRCRLTHVIAPPPARAPWPLAPLSRGPPLVPARGPGQPLSPLRLPGRRVLRRPSRRHLSARPHPVISSFRLARPRPRDSGRLQPIVRGPSPALTAGLALPTPAPHLGASPLATRGAPGCSPQAGRPSGRRQAVTCWPPTCAAASSPRLGPTELQARLRPAALPRVLCPPRLQGLQGPACRCQQVT